MADVQDRQGDQMSGTDKIGCAACGPQPRRAAVLRGVRHATAPALSCGPPARPANKFCGECGAPRPAPSSAPAGTPRPRRRPAWRHRRLHAETPGREDPHNAGAIEGERKTVTVMFSDVSGFTAMSERLDPEDVHVIMDRVFEVILERGPPLRGNDQPVPR